MELLGEIPKFLLSFRLSAAWRKLWVSLNVLCMWAQSSAAFPQSYMHGLCRVLLGEPWPLPLLKIDGSPKGLLWASKGADGVSCRGKCCCGRGVRGSLLCQADHCVLGPQGLLRQRTWNVRLWRIGRKYCRSRDSGLGFFGGVGGWGKAWFFKDSFGVPRWYTWVRFFSSFAVVVGFVFTVSGNVSF